MNSKLLARITTFFVLSTIGGGYAIAAPILQQTSPEAISYTFGTDFTYMTYSAVDDVTASVEAVNLALGAGNSSTSGCNEADFSSFTSGNIALIQRGGCFFQTKAELAATAGAVGVLIFNQGDTEDRKEPFLGTLQADYSGAIPVLSLSYDLGYDFAFTTGLEVRMSVDQSVPPSAVPEPQTVVLLSAGLFGLAFGRRRKQQA